MRYLNKEKIESITLEKFESQKPFPWINPQGFLSDDGFSRLTNNLPDLSLFELDMGQIDSRVSNRMLLRYTPELPVSEVWHEFVDELHSKTYREFIEELLGVKRFGMRCHWHFGRTGCFTAPHVDSVRKFGSQIFYLNKSGEWDESWGGQTSILKPASDKRLNPRETYSLAEFETVARSKVLDNHSLIWANASNAWHAVDEIHCPDDRLRKIFTIIFEERPSFTDRVVGRLRRQFSPSQAAT